MNQTGISVLSTLKLMASCISMAGWEMQAARPGGSQEFLCSSLLFLRNNKWPTTQEYSVLQWVHLCSRGMILRILNVSISLFFHSVLLRLYFHSLLPLFTDIFPTLDSLHSFTPLTDLHQQSKNHPPCTITC